VMRRPLIFRVWIPKPYNEPHIPASTNRDGRQLLLKRRRSTALLLLLPALIALLGLGLGFALFAFHFLLALLDDLGLGRSTAFYSHCLRGLLFFNLQRHNVRQHTLGIGDQLDLRRIDR